MVVDLSEEEVGGRTGNVAARQIVGAEACLAILRDEARRARVSGIMGPAVKRARSAVLLTAAVGVVLAIGALGAFMYFGVDGSIQQSVNFMPWIGMPEFISAVLWVAILGPLLTLIPTLVLTRKYLKV